MTCSLLFLGSGRMKVEEEGHIASISDRQKGRKDEQRRIVPCTLCDRTSNLFGIGVFAEP